MISVGKSSTDRDQTNGEPMRKKGPHSKGAGVGKAGQVGARSTPELGFPSDLNEVPSIIVCLCQCPEPVAAPFYAPLPARPTESGGTKTHTQILQAAPEMNTRHQALHVTGSESSVAHERSVLCQAPKA